MQANYSIKKNIFLTILLFNIVFFSSISIKAEKNKTTITTDGGIEVFQEKQYYYLTKNVNIYSEDFDLKADNVTAYYDKDFYDLVKIIAVGNTKIVMNDGSIISGNKIIYKIKSEEFSIKGNGIFNNKRLKVEGEHIDGVFIKINNETLVKNVTAKDPKKVFIQNKEMKFYSKSATYTKENETLELFDDVKIIKNSEITTGDYANINMLTNDYSIKSIDNKVKLLINSNN